MPTKQNREKFVQVTLTDEEHQVLKQEAAARRTSMSALLASSWLSSRASSNLVVPMDDDDLRQLEMDAAYVGVTPWELLTQLWCQWRSDDPERDSSMRGRHFGKETTIPAN